MPSFRKSYKRLLMSSCVILIFVIRWVHSAKADCVVSDWPRSCEANFKVGPEKCEPCESGKYGCNCSHDCNGSYGLNCYFICDCLGDQYCHPVLGCINVTTTSPVTTQSTSNTDSASTTSNPLSVSWSRTAPTNPGKQADPSLTLWIVVVVLVTLLVIGIITCSCCFFVLLRRKSKTTFYSGDTKSSVEVVDAEEQNNDTHSYLTISDRSDRLYAAVHYDEAEDRKSSSPISLRSITEHNSSDSSKSSDAYLVPVSNDVEESKTDSETSSDNELHGPIKGVDTNEIQP
uniref:Uncharacterized protein LOC111137773 isoform X1 n=1 Tax=Crassostrea virginica TaxID=6565 RepID=A0A8B8EYK7_CRAVI|nr:uncharacterized protein LOC111137773 isoform X1 [Crassostrea virginica]